MAGATDENPASEDDNISLTSTLEADADDSDLEWFAEGILTERSTEEGPRYLVEWSGYPLADATWEPSEHLTGTLLSDWQELKAKIKSGQAKSFKVRQWRDASIQSLRQKHKRHVQRNALRVQQGIQPTEWDRGLDELIEGMEEFYPSDESDSDIAPSPNYSGPETSSAKPVAEGTKKIGGQTGSTPMEPTSTTPSSDGARSSSGVKRRHTAIAEPQPSNKPEPNGVAQMMAGKKRLPALLPKKQPTTAAKNSNIFIERRISSDQAVSNVFAGGTTRKKRVTLKEQAADTSKDPKFVKARYRRLLEKGSRDQENEAPKQRPKNLISLDSSVPTTTLTSQTTQGQQGQSPNESEKPDEPVRSPPQRSSLKRTASGQDLGAKRPSEAPRRKSVHWDEEIQTVEVPYEASLFVQDDFVDSPDAMADSEEPDDPQGIRRAPTPPLGHDRERAAASSLPPRSVPKKCCLGSANGREIFLLFHNIPQDSSFTWLARFSSQQPLVFSHTCIAQSFGSQFRRDSSQYHDLARGFVSAVTEQSALDTVADRLRSTGQGILCHASEFCILLFPRKSSEWGFEATDTSETDHPMGYVIFHPGELRPEDLAPEKGNAKGQSEDKNLTKGLQQLYSLDYQAVCPPKLQKSNKHHFFLAFPSSYLEQARLIASWLQVASKAEVECVVFDSFSPGDWAHYVDEAFNAGGGGLIIHEEATWKIRQFPRMFDVLHAAVSGKFTVSVLKTSSRETVASMWSSKPQILGDICLKRLTLIGKAFLLTPGFIVSRPKQAARFVDFFYKSYGGRHAEYKGKLAIPTGFVEWLGLVLAQKIETANGQWADLQQQKESLSKIATTITGLLQDDETKSSLEVAPASIDPNDEQSLVNWLGWWSIQHLDKYGRSYVCGSDFTVLKTKLRLQPLRYQKGIKSNPGSEVKDDGDSSRIPQSPAATAKSSMLVPNDDPSTLRNYLQDLQGNILQHPTPLWLYFRPIAYWREGMAFEAGDIRGVSATTIEWFNTLNPFSRLVKEAGVLRNSYLSFFYTVEEDKESGAASRKERRPVYRPWIGIVRPSKPHIRPWTQTEMFIWDMAYQGKFGNRPEVREEELDQVHRTVLELVNQRNAAKNPNMPLSKVWIGGWDVLTSKYTSPLDITLDYLGKFASDVKHWIPAPANHLEERGWKFVNPPDMEGGDRKDDDGDIVMDVDDSDKNDGDTNENAEDEEGDDEDYDDDNDEGSLPKIIFHPPRGSCRGPKGTSLCKNILYTKHTAATKHRRREPFDYSFPMTKMWYGQQVAEGRDYKHMMVDSWKTVFDQLRLPTDE